MSTRGIFYEQVELSFDILTRLSCGSGLQHIVHNMSEDVHTSLSHWEEYMKQLKQLEALMRVEERRERFIWSCLRNTPHAKFEHRFERFKGSLHEGRWREVVFFINAISRLLGPLATAWDEGRYVRGVDFEGKEREEQAKTQQRHDDRQGLHSFNPTKLSEILRSSLFHLYTSMILLVSDVPDILSKSSEACPCHEDVFVGEELSLYRRQKLMEQHYGPGITQCPMAGKLLPEIVTGRLLETCERVWNQQESELLQLPWRGSPPSQKEWGIIIDDFNKAKASTMAHLKLKTSYLQRLPWLFIQVPLAIPPPSAAAPQARLGSPGGSVRVRGKGSGEDVLRTWTLELDARFGVAGASGP